jgi:hypothetical protein
VSKPETTKPVKLGIELEIDLPAPPNWLRSAIDDTPFSVAQFSDAQLRKIGKAWTEQLITHARGKR